MCYRRITFDTSVVPSSYSSSPPAESGRGVVGSRHLNPLSRALQSLFAPEFLVRAPEPFEIRDCRFHLSQLGPQTRDCLAEVQSHALLSRLHLSFACSSAESTAIYSF